MEEMKINFFKQLGISMLMLLGGCATTSLQTQAKLTKTIVIDHSETVNKYVYLQVTNASGENERLYNEIKFNLQSKGYVVTSSSKESQYSLFVNVLFANNLKEANAVKNGLSAGVTAGTVSVISGRGSSNSLLVGASAALAGAIVGKAFEDEVYRAVVDISIRKYTGDNIRTMRTQNDVGGTIGNTQRAGNLNALAGPIGNVNGSGDMNSGISESITTESYKNYEEYRTRGFIEATKMNLKLDEALPILESKIANQIVNIF